MNYTETIDYLLTKLPIYQRVGAVAYKTDLKNTLQICKIIGNPEKKLKFIHIAGTNGKGSSSHMIASVLQESGYKTGLYTSPHLLDFRERIKVNGNMIGKTDVLDFVKQYQEHIEPINASFFEWTVGLAFDYFAKSKVDIVVLETGLGGRLDSTNVVKPLLSLITNISIDHANLLGNDILQIAEEKAGIIKTKVPVVVSESQPGCITVFRKKALETKSVIDFADKLYKINAFKHNKNLLELEVLKKETGEIFSYSLDIVGLYQLKNILGVIKSIEILKLKGFFIEEKVVQKGLRNVVKNTGLMGRWQIHSEKPLVVLDTAHNADGIKEMLLNLERYTFNQLHFVLGVVNDKEIKSVLEQLPKNAIYYFCKANIPRAMNETELSQLALKYKLNGKTFVSVEKALLAAKKAFKAKDLILVSGSTFTVAEVL